MRRGGKKMILTVSELHLNDPGWRGERRPGGEPARHSKTSYDAAIYEETISSDIHPDRGCAGSVFYKKQPWNCRQRPPRRGLGR